MKDKLIWFLSLAVLVLLVVLAFLIGVNFQTRQAHRPVVSAPEAAPLPASSPSNFPGVKNLTDGGDSFGEQAGETYGEFEKKANATYEETRRQAEKTGAELNQSAQEAAQVFQSQMQETAQNFQKAAQEMMQNLQREMEKFNESLRRQRQQP